MQGQSNDSSLRRIGQEGQVSNNNQPIDQSNE
jgi:hypothetical protein